MKIYKYQFICEHLYNILFKEQQIYINLDEICYYILWASVKIGDEYCQIIIKELPKFYSRQGQTQFTIKLYNSLVSFGVFPKEYVYLIRMKQNKKYIKSNIDSLKKVYKANISDPSILRWWVNYKIEKYGIGNYNDENSARNILKKGVNYTNSAGTYLYWAKLELSQNNIGDYNTVNSAKWILKQGIEKTHHPSFYLRLAELEVKENNIGDYNTAYSAKWILKQGIEKNHALSFYLRLAELEFLQDNLGDSNSKWSVTYLIEKAVKKEYLGTDENIIKAITEIKKNNIGDFTVENSAKWYLIQSLKDIIASYTFLAAIELQVGNIGNEQTEYSVRWIIKKASDRIKYFSYDKIFE
ncbi:MAG: hypothetical protein K8S23_00525 [Candidatus Cloacimonetes bacterium]|nr:hypothetical protein [Candidatus Cloacimonadota bacterium]